MQTRRQQKLMKVIGFVAITVIVLGMILPYLSVGTPVTATTAVSIMEETALTQQVTVPADGIK